MRAPIYEIIHGSTCYGLNTSTSDIDIKGIFIPSKRQYYTLDKGKDVHEFMNSKHGGNDAVYVSIEKFVSLAINSNPNILEQLFVEPKFVMKSTPYSAVLINNRDLFVTKKVINSYIGYSVSQLKRMCSIEKNAEGKRKDSFDKFGYDTKNAMHLIRLLKMGIEILKEGKVNTFRNDRDELLKIREGEYSIQEITDRTEFMREEIRELERKTTIPDEPDLNKVNNMLYAIVEMYHRDEDN
jgi:predicted nucleotidyltransferase